MKKSTFTLFISAMLMFGNAFGQTSVELPIKNEMIYYSFENSMSNTKKCLSEYLGTYDFSKKCLAKCQEVTSQKSRPFLNKNYSFMQSITPVCLHGACACNDTTVLGQLILGLPVDIKPTTLYNLGKKKIVSHSIEAKVQIVFKSKSDYVLKLKGFTYKCMTGNAFKMENEEYPLEEMYNDFVKNSNPNKSQINLFTDLNQFMLEADRILKECFQELYKIDELD